VVYKEHSVFLLNYNGSVFVYDSQQPEAEMGVLAPGSIVGMGGRHVYVGQDNLYQFNGASNQAFGTRVWQYIMGLIPRANKADIWAMWDPRFKEIVFGMPGTGKALVWNYEFDAFSVRDWPFTAAGFARTPASIASDLRFDDLMDPMHDYDQPIQILDQVQDYGLLAGDGAGKLWMLDETVATANGAAIPAVYQTGTSAFGADRLKIVGGMSIACPVLTGAPLQLWVSARMTLAEPVNFTLAGTFVAGQRSGTFRRTGIWFDFKFVKPDGDWIMQGFTPWVQLRGVQ
jgi:hypothetical protein